MANPEQSQERCPSCDGNEIKADKRYGNKLKGREFTRRLFRNPIYWIAFALVILPAWIPMLNATGQTAWRYGLEALGFVLVIVLSIREYRAVFGPGAAFQFPEVSYTCSLCGHKWNSEEVRTAESHETAERETSSDPAPSETAREEQQPETKENSTTGVPQILENRPSGWGSQERRPAFAAIAALAAAIATFILPALLLMDSGGEMCPGYQVDVGWYYGKIVPLALIAAVLGFVSVMNWPKLLKSETSTARVGCGIAAIVASCLVCGLISIFLATFPGC